MLPPTHSWQDEVKSLPRPAWILFAGTFINRFGGFVLIFLVLYLTKKGYSAPQAGIAASTYGVGSVIAAFVGGYLADRLGRRNTIAISMFSSAAAMVALSQADSLGLILGLAGVAGFAAELYRPASYAMLTDLTPPGFRVTGFALYRLAINLGFTVGPAVGGLLAERAFVYLFIGDAITSTIFGVIALVALPKTRPTDEQQSKSTPGTVRQMLTDWPFVIFCFSTLLSAFVYLQIFTTFSLQIRDWGYSDATYGALVSFNGFLVMLFELPVSFITRRHAARPIIAVGLAMVGVGFWMFSWVGALVGIVAAVFVVSAGEIIMMPVATAYVADLAPHNMRGRYMGLWGSTFGFGMVLGPGIGAMLFSRSPQLLWTCCLALGLIAAILVATTRHKPTMEAPHGGDAPQSH